MVRAHAIARFARHGLQVRPVIADVDLILLLAWGLYTTIVMPSKRWLRTIGARYLSPLGRPPKANLAPIGLDHAYNQFPN
jgi:hypothetical protein